MTEAQIEAKLGRLVKARGGLCLKWTSPGMPGVPDRIVITPKGRVIFVELKTEIGRLSNIQRWVHEQLRSRGADVRTIKSPEAVADFVREVMPHEV